MSNDFYKRLHPHEIMLYHSKCDNSPIGLSAKAKYIDMLREHEQALIAFRDKNPDSAIVPLLNAKTETIAHFIAQN